MASNIASSERSAVATASSGTTVLVLIRVLLLAGILVRLYIGATAPPRPMIKDALGYWTLATSLREHGEFSFELGRPTAFRTPAYPAFLAAVHTVTGPSQRATMLVQALLSSSVLFLVLGALRALRVSDLATALAMAAVAFYPPFLKSVGLLGTEALALPLAALMFYCWAKDIESGSTRWLVAMGITVGFAALVRPVALLLLPVFAFASWVGNRLDLRRWRAWAVTAVACVAVVLPWMARNASQGLSFTLETLSGFQAFLDVAPLEQGADPALGWRRDWPEAKRLAANVLTERLGHPVEFPVDYPHTLGGLDEGVINKVLMRRHWEIVREQPLQFLRMRGCRFVNLWGDLCSEDYGPRLYLLAVANFGIVLLLLVGLAVGGLGRGPLGMLGCALFVYYSAVHLAVTAHDRYIWPAMVMMLPAAVAVAASWFEPARGRR